MGVGCTTPHGLPQARGPGLCRTCPSGPSPRGLMGRGAPPLPWEAGGGPGPLPPCEPRAGAATTKAAIVSRARLRRGGGRGSGARGSQGKGVLALPRCPAPSLPPPQPHKGGLTGNPEPCSSRGSAASTLERCASGPGAGDPLGRPALRRPGEPRTCAGLHAGLELPFVSRAPLPGQDRDKTTPRTGLGPGFGAAPMASRSSLRPRGVSWQRGPGWAPQATRRGLGVSKPLPGGGVGYRGPGRQLPRVTGPWVSGHPFRHTFLLEPVPASSAHSRGDKGLWPTPRCWQPPRPSDSAPREACPAPTAGWALLPGPQGPGTRDLTQGEAARHCGAWGGLGPGRHRRARGRGHSEPWAACPPCGAPVLDRHRSRDLARLGLQLASPGRTEAKAGFPAPAPGPEWEVLGPREASRAPPKVHPGRGDQPAGEGGGRTGGA